MSLCILLISLIEFYLGGVGERDVAVDAAHLILAFRKVIGCFKELLGYSVEVLFACELVIAYIDILGFRQDLIHVRNLVEEAHKLKVEV